MSISQKLLEPVLTTSIESIPLEKYVHAKIMIKDTIAVAFVGKNAPGIREIVEIEQEFSAQGKATVFFHDLKISLPGAVFLNSSIIHAMDFDDVYIGPWLHSMSVVMPIVFAIGQVRSLKGNEVLAALILGIEAAGKITFAYNIAHKKHDFFLQSSLLGGFGGVAAACRLLGLNLEESINAFGIYYAHTSGNRQALLERKLTKRIQPAIAARNAVYSAILASKGFTGPQFVFEGEAGLFNSYTLENAPDENEFISLADNLKITSLGIKKIPTCGIHHPNIIAALYIKNNYNFKTKDIESVKIYIAEGCKTLVSMPFTIEENVQINAQFCAPYGVALALVKGAVNITDFSVSSINSNSEISNLAQSIEIINIFDQLDLKNYSRESISSDMKFVKVILKNGTIFEKGVTSKMSYSSKYIPGLPDHNAKFEQCLDAAGIDINKRNSLRNEIENFNFIKNINTFINDFLL